MEIFSLFLFSKIENSYSYCFQNPNRTHMKSFLSFLLASFTFIAGYAQHVEWGIPTHEFLNFGIKTIDNNGNLYIIGGINRDSAYLGPGSGNRYISPEFSGSDGFLAKLNPKGEIIWGRTLAGGTNLRNVFLASADDGFFLAANFEDSVDLDTGPLQDMYYNWVDTDTFIHFYTDILLAKYDTAGNYQWGFAVEGVRNDEIEGISSDAQGNVYVVGDVGDSRTFDFDPGPGVYYVPSLYANFMAKYSGSNGDLIWAHGMAGSFEGITADPQGGFYAFGHTSFRGDLDPGPGVLRAGNSSPYFVKYTDDAEYVFHKAIIEPASYSVTALSLSPSREVYIIGEAVPGTHDFDPGPGIDSLSSRPGHRVETFLSKYSPQGDYEWTRLMGRRNSNDWGSNKKVSVDSSGKLYLPILVQDTFFLYKNETVFDTFFNYTTRIQDRLIQFDSDGNYLGIIGLDGLRVGEISSNQAGDVMYFSLAISDNQGIMTVDNCDNVFSHFYIDSTGFKSTSILLQVKPCQPTCITSLVDTVSAPLGGQLDLSVTTNGGTVTSYQWKKDGIPLTDNAIISGAQTASLSMNPYTDADSGAYSCKITSECSGSTESSVAWVSSGWPVSLEGPGKLREVNLYPNPVNDLMKVSVSQTYPTATHLEIKDLLGKTIYKTSFQGKTELSLGEYEVGIYFVSLENQGAYYHTTILKQ